MGGTRQVRWCAAGNGALVSGSTRLKRIQRCRGGALASLQTSPLHQTKGRRWDADDREEPRGGDRERQELLKSRWSKSHGEGAWRLDLDHISRGRHRTGSVFKVPVFVVPQLATSASWA